MGVLFVLAITVAQGQNTSVPSVENITGWPVFASHGAANISVSPAVQLRSVSRFINDANSIAAIGATLVQNWGDSLPSPRFVIVPQLPGQIAGYSAPGFRVANGEHPIILISAPAVEAGFRESVNRLLVHEWAHVAHYALGRQSEPWIQEGVALLMETKMNSSAPLAMPTDEWFRQPLLMLRSGASAHAEGSSLHIRNGWQAHYQLLRAFFYYLDRVCFHGDFLKNFAEGRETSDDEATIHRLIVAQRSGSPVCQSFGSVWTGFARALYKPEFVSNEQTLGTFIHWSMNRVPRFVSRQEIRAAAAISPGERVAVLTEPLVRRSCAGGELPIAIDSSTRPGTPVLSCLLTRLPVASTRSSGQRRLR